MDDKPEQPRVTDDVGTAREWADETGDVPVRTGREHDTSDRVALVPEGESGDFERLDWPAFDEMLHDADEVVVYDGSGRSGGLSVVDADQVTTDGERTGEEEYAEHEMRGEGAPAAPAGEHRPEEGVREERADRGARTTHGLQMDDVGKTVVDEEGTELGIVAQASGEEGAVHVDVAPGVVERVLSKLGWTGEEDVDYVIPGERIVRVTDDRVVLASGDIETAGE